MKTFFYALLAALALSAPALAAPDYKTLETGYNWDTYFSSFTSVTSKTVDPTGFGSVGFSSFTANSIGFSYVIYPVGADANYVITYTTATPNSATAPTGFNNPSPFGLAKSAAALVNTSRINVPNGAIYTGNFQAATINPYFTFSNLSTAATYYVWIELGRQRKP